MSELYFGLPSFSLLQNSALLRTDRDRASQSHRCVSRTEKGQRWMSHHPVLLNHPVLYQLVGSRFTSGWEMTSELGKLTLFAHFQIGKIWRSPAPKPTGIGTRPNSQKPLAWGKLKRSLFLPHSTDTPVWSKNFNIWTHNYISILLTKNMSTTKFSR